MAAFVAVAAGAIMPGVANSIHSIFQKNEVVMTNAAEEGSAKAEAADSTPKPRVVGMVNHLQKGTLIRFKDQRTYQFVIWVGNGKATLTPCIGCEIRITTLEDIAKNIGDDPIRDIVPAPGPDWDGAMESFAFQN